MRVRCEGRGVCRIVSAAAQPRLGAYELHNVRLLSDWYSIYIRLHAASPALV